MNRVSQAMKTVHRIGFLPDSCREHWRVDAPLPIGHGQTNSQPTTVANMLELLDVRPGQRVLDVGAGSGWSTALLATLTGPDGTVTGTELVPALTAFGQKNLSAHHFPNAEIRQAVEGVFGLPDEGPFDRILVSAEAPELPADLVAQLADDGVLVIPVAGEMLRVGMRDGTAEITRHGRYRFVPLLRG
ncbi:protein-L-isoaspartate O-methyltransferase [Corynebacterium sp.]|uniref:protein-L-isoaspartate O-methyltransferase family protein n=1 Tax=Corynebacterium sp. TaxID=1720 RepID=UPI003734F0F1